MLVLQKTNISINLTLISFINRKLKKIHDVRQRWTFSTLIRLVIQFVSKAVIDLKMSKEDFSTGRPYHIDYKKLQ